jgi:hypothetical protein
VATAVVDGDAGRDGEAFLNVLALELLANGPANADTIKECEMY